MPYPTVSDTPTFLRSLGSPSAVRALAEGQHPSTIALRASGPQTKQRPTTVSTPSPSRLTRRLQRNAYGITAPIGSQIHGKIVPHAVPRGTVAPRSQATPGPVLIDRLRSPLIRLPSCLPRRSERGRGEDRLAAPTQERSRPYTERKTLVGIRHDSAVHTSWSASGTQFRSSTRGQRAHTI